MRTRLWTFVLLAAVTVSARGQLRLPALPLPLQTLTQAVDRTNSGLDRASGVRRAAINRLIGANRRLLEADPHGEPIVRNEILALSPSDSAMEHARSLGFLVAREQFLAAADLHVVILQAPEPLSTSKALNVLRLADPDGTYEYNHIYTGAGADDATGHAKNPAGPANVAPSSASIRVGLLDTGVDVSHPVFRDSTIHTWGCDNKPTPALHGTAVASLLVNRSSAELFTADVYCGLPTGGAVDAIVAALEWLASERVAVINVSLVGPKNVLLERTVAALTARGYLIVAAVGNDGPTAPPLYPAAYPDVVGVTGVDAKRRVLLEAERGPQVMFAAQGADIKAANTEHSFTDVRGTSFAAPTVARLLAKMSKIPDKSAAAAAIAVLTRQAVDLGTAGRDLTFGIGFVSAETL